jgi:N6-adenosine-specific RNA methylase IME4
MRAMAGMDSRATLLFDCSVLNYLSHVERTLAQKDSRMTPPRLGLPGLKGPFSTILVDPPWRFDNRTGKMAPEHKRLRRYRTMSMDEIAELPVAGHASEKSHLYLWCPNALLPHGLKIMEAWGFKYKTNIVWYKVRKDGGPDGRGVGFYFRNVTELLLFGIRGRLRTLRPGRRQTNIVISHKQEHSRKPEAIYGIIEACSPGPYLELFARERVDGWTCWGDQVDTYLKSRPVYPAYTGNGKRHLVES